MIIKKGIFFKKSNEYDTNLILCPICKYDRESYIAKRKLIRTISAMILAYFYGYFIYSTLYSVRNASTSVVIFVISYILSFYILQIPHEFIKIMFYPIIFNTEDLKLYFFHKKRLIIPVYTGKASNMRVLLSSIVPFITLTILPSIILYLFGFNIILYGILAASIILCAEDILNIALLIFRSDNDKYIYELNNTSL